jgi:biopolymer transport protein ExbD
MGATESKPEVRKSITLTKTREVFLDGNPVEIEKLADSLLKLKAANPGVKLELEADTDTALGSLMKIWDALRAAGFTINEVPARIQRSGGK